MIHGHTHVHSAAWSARGHTAETFLTLSDLIFSGSVSEMGEAADRHTLVMELGLGSHTELTVTQWHTHTHTKYFTVGSIHLHPGMMAACVMVSPLQNTVWRTPAQPVMMFVLVQVLVCCCFVHLEGSHNEIPVRTHRIPSSSPVLVWGSRDRRTRRGVPRQTDRKTN